MKDSTSEDIIKNIGRVPYLRMFLVLLCVVILAFSIFTHYFVIIPFKGLLLENTVNEAKRTAIHLKKMFILGDDWIDTTKKDHVFHLNILELLDDFEIIKLKMFKRDGTVIYSTDPSEVGDKINSSEFKGIVAKGQIYSKIVEKDHYSTDGKKQTQSVAEIFIPIMSGDQFTGSFEIYYDLSQKNKQFALLQLKTATILILLLVTLVIFVVIILYNGSKVSLNKKKAEEAVINLNDSLMELVHEQTMEIQVTQRTSIEALAKLAEYNDTDTGQHLNRIQMYVRILLEDLADDSLYSQYINRDLYIEDVVLASILHDIGKTAIPESILNKPAKLTESEFEVIKGHTVIAGTLLNTANEVFVNQFDKDSYLALARDIATYHHEKWDGTGYPEGLKGEEIPLCARIVALADVYDALTSKRPYKEPWSHKDAYQEIILHDEKHFDPEIVKSFKKKAERFLSISKEYEG